MDMKAAYTLAQIEQLTKMILGAISSDHESCATMLNGGVLRKVVNNANLFDSFSPSPEKYDKLAYGTKMTINGKGTVKPKIRWSKIRYQMYITYQY